MVGRHVNGQMDALNGRVHDTVCSLDWGRLEIAAELHFEAYSLEGWEI